MAVDWSVEKGTVKWSNEESALYQGPSDPIKIGIREISDEGIGTSGIRGHVIFMELQFRSSTVIQSTRPYTGHNMAILTEGFLLFDLPIGLSCTSSVSYLNRAVRDALRRCLLVASSYKVPRSHNCYETSTQKSYRTTVTHNIRRSKL